MSIASRACFSLRCWKCSRRSQERHTLTSSIISCALLKTMLTTTDSIHRCNRTPWRSTVIHRGTLVRMRFFGLQGTQWTQNSAKGVSCTSTRGETSPRTPSRTITWQCATRPLWCHLTTTTSLRTCSCQGLSNQNAAKHRWHHFPKMQMEEVLLFKQFESDTALPGRTIFNIDFVDPTVRPDAPDRQSIGCRAFLYFLDFEPNTCSALPSDEVAKEVASHAERGLWDLLRVRELSEWMRNDVYAEVLVGRMFVNLGMKFAEMATVPAQFSAALSGFLLGCRTQQPQQQLMI